jgi:SAM-dependent methyltransferase
MTKHPAKFSESIIDYLDRLFRNQRGNVLDPFAGTGRIHHLCRPDLYTWGVEIEPEWARMHPRTLIGNALNLPFKNESFNAICTSPAYGNRFADHHNAKDGSTRRSYKHDLGRDLHPFSAGKLHFGPQYKRFHMLAFWECARVLKPKGWVIINVSNFIRKGEEVDVVGFYEELLSNDPFHFSFRDNVGTPRLRYGANSDARVKHEVILAGWKK